MVEGHSVHRVAARFRSKFVGKSFTASSPNGRFTAGAKAIARKPFRDIKAVGKNLFAFFGKSEVVHVHFGMSGRWAIYDYKDAPEPTPTTRLVLSNRRAGLTAHLSAMTVKHGKLDMFDTLRSKLGEDPLDDKADVEMLRKRVARSNKTISRLLMDQSFFAGVGNIYRAEILFCARQYPETKGSELSAEAFDKVWSASVKLMKAGRRSGRITSMTKVEAKKFGEPTRRRYVYNQAHCIVCGSRVSSWSENNRTVWACMNCQSSSSSSSPLSQDKKKEARKRKAVKAERELFFSHCAKESVQDRRHFPSKLKVAELRNELQRLGYPCSGRKRDLVNRLQKHIDDMHEHTADLDMTGNEKGVHGYHRSLLITRRKAKKQKVVDV